MAAADCPALHTQFFSEPIDPMPALQQDEVRPSGYAVPHLPDGSQLPGYSAGQPPFFWQTPHPVSSPDSSRGIAAHPGAGNTSPPQPQEAVFEVLQQKAALMSQLQRSSSKPQLQQTVPLAEVQKPAVAQMAPVQRHGVKCVGGGASSEQGEKGDSTCGPAAQDHALRYTSNYPAAYKWYH